MMFIQSSGLQAKANTPIMDFICSNDNIKTKSILIVVAMDIKECYSCNAPKINGVFKTLRQLINDSKTVMVIESEIPTDAFSLKSTFDSDFFVEDTLLTFTTSQLAFPNIIIPDLSLENILDFIWELHIVCGAP